MKVKVEFKVGDKVEVVRRKRGFRFMFPVGTIGKIKHVIGSPDSFQSITVEAEIKGVKDHWYYDQSMLRLVK